MLDLRTLKHLEQAIKAAQKGDRKTALGEVRQFEEKFAQEGKFANPTEWLEMMGVVAKIYQMVGEWELAALKFEDLCDFAEKHHPHSTEIAGDYYSLSKAREKLGDFQGALNAMEKSTLHLKASGQWTRYQTSYDERISMLQKLISK
ncbi:MAG: hypothetical protein AB1491_05650 [Thermodesulfobacteriota bacterium]